MAYSSLKKIHPLRSSAKKILGDIEYVESAGFPRGQLPTQKNVITNMMYLMRPSRAGKIQRSKDDAALSLAYILSEHWVFCNIYTVTVKVIKRKILNVYSEFQRLHQIRKNRRNERYMDQVRTFNIKAETLFDIFCEKTEIRKKLEKIYGVSMMEDEWEFLNDQRNNREMYCENFVDRKWQKTMDRRKYDIDALERQSQKALSEDNVSQSVDELAISSEPDEDVEATEDQHMTPTCSKLRINKDPDCIPSEDPEDMPSSKRLKVSSPPGDYEKDDIPSKYRHLRRSERKVKNEVYETIDELKSVYHMSENQAEAAIICVGNKLFDRKWKFHDQSEVIDMDTLPHR